MRTKRTLSLLLLAALSLAFACAAPASSGTVSLPPSGPAAPSAPAALLEPRLLTLVHPAVVRRGGLAVIRLTFAPGPDDGLGLTVPRADVFASYNIIAEAKLDLPGIAVRPPGLVSQPLEAGRGVTFTWYVQPQETGQVTGTAWFFLRFVPQDGNAGPGGQVPGGAPSVSRGPDRELPVAALPVGFEVVSLAELDGSAARVVGTIGAFLGLLLALPFLAARRRGG
ncbi:MAG: hypothetical protein FD146_2788 [Anaerolineaceae bacterium]|nr:MAG: hypothetical protein FD146_2788 [Anaerolineaceae bacterium]